VHHIVDRRRRPGRIKQLLVDVGLPSDDAFLRRRPRELSGGERQRAALARALACEPRVLILDEPVSALDASVRGQVLNLLLEIRRRTGLAMLIVAHDITLVGRLCSRVAVLAGGKLVEDGPSTRLLEAPSSAAAAQLLAAAGWLETGSARDGRASSRELGRPL
jgi:peptide/nickel transport system ATP-binding protein